MTFKEIIGLDFSHAALKARKERQPFLKLITGDITALPIKKDTFDMVLIGGVIYNLDEKQYCKVLHNISKIMTKKGVFVWINNDYRSWLKDLNYFIRDIRNNFLVCKLLGLEKVDRTVFICYHFNDQDIIKLAQKNGLHCKWIAKLDLKRGYDFEYMKYIFKRSGELNWLGRFLMIFSRVFPNMSAGHAIYLFEHKGE